MQHAKRIKGTRRHESTRECATYTVAELAQVLGIARNGVYTALRSGKIPHFRLGRRFIVPRAAVDAWFASAYRPSESAASILGRLEA